MLRWLKSHPRYLLAILAITASAYAIDRWFFAGVMASKWIGLPQYASAMKELQSESREWGLLGVGLEALALLLFLPHRQIEKPIKASSLMLVGEARKWEYPFRCAIRLALCVLATIGLAILIPLIVDIVIVMRGN
jgi:hypothetical protein